MKGARWMRNGETHKKTETKWLRTDTVRIYEPATSVLSYVFFLVFFFFFFFSVVLFLVSILCVRLESKRTLNHSEPATKQTKAIGPYRYVRFSLYAACCGRWCMRLFSVYCFWWFFSSPVCSSLHFIDITVHSLQTRYAFSLWKFISKIFVRCSRFLWVKVIFFCLSSRRGALVFLQFFISNLYKFYRQIGIEKSRSFPVHSNEKKRSMTQ